MWGRALGAVLLCGALVACDQPVKLAQPPTLNRLGLGVPMQDVPLRARTVDPEILYVTDRAPLVEDGRLAGYGVERSSSMAFGKARVRFGDFDSWPDLVAHDGAPSRQRQRLISEGYAEAVRFPETPLPYETVDGRGRVQPDAERAYRADIAAFQAAFTEELRYADRKEAIVFIHGFNSELDDGLATAASLWHYAGRIGVPVAYSWPAGNRGLTAYLKDRESGEFSVFHLKEFLRALAEIPELQAIHLIAHSRGADVTTSALRELVIFENGAGRDARRTLKIKTVILAAPDLDFGVVRQRLAAEGTAKAAGQVNIYLNPKDGALGLAQALTTGTRIGRLSPERLTEQEWEQLGEIPNVHFIDVESAGGRLGHAYFRDNPAVLSDVVLTLRTGAMPGSRERPLDPVRSNFWSLHPNYPGPRIVVVPQLNSDR
jgi:esterase/lipase superfamily enzyme